MSKKKQETYGIPASPEAEREGEEIVQRMEFASMPPVDRKALKRAYRDMRRWSRKYTRPDQEDEALPQAYFPYHKKILDAVKSFLEKYAGHPEAEKLREQLRQDYIRAGILPKGEQPRAAAPGEGRLR